MLIKHIITISCSSKTCSIKKSCLYENVSLVGNLDDPISNVPMKTNRWWVEHSMAINSLIKYLCNFSLKAKLERLSVSLVQVISRPGCNHFWIIIARLQNNNLLPRDDEMLDTFFPLSNLADRSAVFRASLRRRVLNRLAIAEGANIYRVNRMESFM